MTLSTFSCTYSLFSLVKCLLRSFANFKVGLFFFSLLSCKSSLWFLMQVLYQILQIFSLPATCLFSWWCLWWINKYKTNKKRLMGVTKMLANLGLPLLTLPPVAQWGSGSCPWRIHCSYFLIVLQLVHARSSWPFFWACDFAFQHYSTNPFSWGSERPKTQSHSSVGRILSNHLPSRICSPISCGLANRCSSPGLTSRLGPALPPY